MILTDVIGPIMVGPSSSHTAGAVKIGRVARRLLDEDVARARILFHGSFLSTGKGHGTDRAVVAGLMGFTVDDERIPQSLEIARERGIELSMGGVDLGIDAHPNSVQLFLTGIGGRELELIGSSIGGGRIRVDEVDDLPVSFSGDFPTLIVHNVDQPGHVAEVTSMLQHKSVNIADMQLSRAQRGGKAVMVLELDQEVPREALRWLEHLEGVIKVTYLSLAEPLGDEPSAIQGKEKKHV